MDRNRTRGSRTAAVLVGVAAMLGLVPIAAGAASGGDGAFPSSQAKAWKRVSPSGFPGTIGFNVVTTEKGYAAIARSAPGSTGGFTPLVSTNGLAWRPVAVDDALFPADAVFQRATSGPGGVVVPGSVGPEGQDVQVFWTSAEGTRWSRTAPDPAAFGAPGADLGVNMVVQVARRRYVGVGFDNTTGVPSAAVWTSGNGRKWSRVTTGGDLAAAPDEGIVLYGVASGPKGYVTVGTRRFLEGGDVQEEPAVWSSENAKRWTRRTRGVSAPAGFRADATGSLRTPLRDVAATRAGFVATGNQRTSGGDGLVDGLGFVLTSADGIRWRAGTTRDGTFRQSASGGTFTTIDRVVAAGDGFVAIGDTLPLGDEASVARIWTSGNGRSWAAVPERLGSGFRTGSVAAGGSGAVVLGGGSSAGSDTLDRPAAWLGGRP